MKNLHKITFISFFIFVGSLDILAQEKITVPWLDGDANYIANSEENLLHYSLVGTNICHFDSLDNLLCFEAAWRNECLEVFASFSLSDEIPYIFSRKALPVLEVLGFNKIDLNGLIELEKKTGPILPWAYNEDFLIWRVEVGSLETLQKAEGGIFFHLLNGEEMTIYFTLQNGDVMRSRVTLFGLKPLLEDLLVEARELKPEGQCAG